MAVKIITSYWRKPIPTNKMDWVASLDDRDGEGPHGYGATEAEAIDDLRNWLDDDVLAEIDALQQIAAE